MYDYKVIKTRPISIQEYEKILNIFKKNNIPIDNFLNNIKTLTINEIDEEWYLLNGYDAENNVLYYNKHSNFNRELIHIASSNRTKEQGIMIKPRKFYPKTRGFGFNEGICDYFLELLFNEDGFFTFEKICVKCMVHVYGVNLFKSYFLNDDLSLRENVSRRYARFLSKLDEYTDNMMILKKSNLMNAEFPLDLKFMTKIYFEVALDELKEVLHNDNNKKYQKYLEKLLQEGEMQKVYEMLN